MSRTNRMEIEIGVNDKAARKEAASFASDFNSQIKSMAQGASGAGGPLGGLLNQIGSIKAVMLGAAAGVGALAMQWFDLAKTQAAAAEATVNLADRTGMTIGQVDRLQAMAQIANVNVNALGVAARSLANGLEDTSAVGNRAWKALQELGVSTVDVTGKQRDLGQVTLDVIERLGGIENAAKRTALANAALGRGSVELMPLIKNYQQLDQTVREMGYGTRDGLIKSLAEADDKMDALGLRWEMLKGKLATPLTAVIDIITRAAQGPNTITSGGATMVVPDFLLDRFGARPLGSSVPGVGDPASAALAADRAAAFRSMLAADPRTRLSVLTAEMGKIQSSGLSGEAGQLAKYNQLRAEKSALERLIKDTAELTRQREQLLKMNEKISERYGDLLTGGLGRPGSFTGGMITDLSTENLLGQAASEQAARYRTPFDSLGFQGQVAGYAVDQYDALATAEKERSAEAKRLIGEQQQAYETMLNRLRSGFESTFDSLVRGGANAAQTIRNLFLSALLTPIKQAASAMFANIFMPIAMGGRGGGGFMSRAMGGGGGMAPFGALSSMSTATLGAASMIGPGGTAPFVGGGGGGVGSFAGFGGMATSMKGSLSMLGNLGRGVRYDDAGFAYQGSNGVGGATGGAMLAGGGILAADGIRRGGWTGAFETAAGGALIGGKFGGWTGAAIGASVGFTVGLIRMMFKSASDKAREKVKSYHGVDISDKGILSQIVSVAKSSYGGNLDVAVRAREIVDLIQLYAMSTGQKMSNLDNRPMGVNLSQMGGSFYQTGSYSNGVGYSYGGSIQAVAGLSAFASSSAAAPIVLDSEGTKQFWSDVMATGIVQNPRAVQKASLSAQSQNYGRTSTAVNLTDPLGATI